MLTADGDRYLQTCVRTLAELREAESALASNRTRAGGKLVIGLSRVIGPNCVMPFLPEFVRRHPDLELDIRAVHYPQEPLAAMCDLLVLISWGEEPDWIMRTIAWNRIQVCAAPQYWSEHGIPQQPEDLLHHRCLAYRLPRGLVYDRWKFRRGDETRSVAVKPYLIADDRDTLMQAVIRRHRRGVAERPDGDAVLAPWRAATGADRLGRPRSAADPVALPPWRAQLGQGARVR